MFKWLNKIRLKGLPTKTDNNVVVVDDNGDLGINTGAGAASYHGRADILIKPSDFISDKENIRYEGGGVIDNTSSAVLYAHVIIPGGSSATHVAIYGNDASAVVVYATNVTTATETSKGTGNIGDSSIDITDIPSSDFHMISVKITPADQDTTRVYGGLVTLT